MGTELNKEDLINSFLSASLTVSEKTGKLQLVLTEEMYKKAKEEFGDGCGFDKNKVQIWVYPEYNQNGQQ